MIQGLKIQKNVKTRPEVRGVCFFSRNRYFPQHSLVHVPTCKGLYECIYCISYEYFHKRTLICQNLLVFKHIEVQKQTSRVCREGRYRKFVSDLLS